jgi:hypothetical protein
MYVLCRPNGQVLEVELLELFPVLTAGAAHLLNHLQPSTICSPGADEGEAEESPVS